MVMVAFSLVVILGFGAFAVDLGHVAVVKSDLQNAADAAALAGAADLPDQDAAREAAEEYARNNGLDDSEYTTTTSDDEVRVVCSRTVDYFFAGAIGVDSKDVTAVAVARTGSDLPSAFTDYSVFSESETVPLAFGKNNGVCLGTIHTNNKLNLGKNLTITRAEARLGFSANWSANNQHNNIKFYDQASDSISIPDDFKEALQAQVELAPIQFTGTKTFNNNSQNLDQSIYVDGKVIWTGNNLVGKGFLYATGDIEITGNNTQIGTAAEPVFIYSEKNITISGNNAEMFCIIFAPNGKIDVQKNNWVLHGSLIGKEFSDTCLKNNATIIANGDFSGVPLGDGSSKLVE